MQKKIENLRFEAKLVTVKKQLKTDNFDEHSQIFHEYITTQY